MIAAERAHARAPGYDVSDFLDDGGTVEDLLALIHATPEWHPAAPNPEPTERRSNLVVGLAPGLRVEDVRPRTMTAQQLVCRVYPEPKWPVPGVVPEGASLLVGPPKKGKSFLLLGVCVSVAAPAGVALGKVAVDHGDVLYMGLEDGERRLQERLLRILDGEPAPARLHLATEWPRLDQGGAEELDAWLTAHPNARLVGVDVLARVRPPASGSAGLYQADYQTMAAFKEVVDRHRVALVAVHHARKLDADDPLDTVSGTHGLAAAADTILVFKRKVGEADATLYVRGRDVAEADHALSFDGPSGRWNLLGDAAQFRLTAGRAEVVGLLRAGAPMAPKDIAAALGVDRGNVRVLLHRMKQAGQIVVVADGLYSAPPCDRVTPGQADGGRLLHPSDGSVTLPGVEKAHEYAEIEPGVTPLQVLHPQNGREVIDL